MIILLLGRNGQVGWELQRSLAPLGQLITVETQSQDLCGDFTHPQGILQTLETVKPDVVVNAAAYTAVDKAESEAELAYTINAHTPGVLAEACKRSGAWLVHYSTDYVFNGSGSQPWQEQDATAPLSVYGASKLAGETAIQAVGGKHLLFRTSWVYAAAGNNFAKTMLRLAQERDKLSVINDQFGAPTGAELLADVTAHAIKAAWHNPELAGLYHLVAAGETNWFEYARHCIEFARAAGLPIRVASEAIQAIATSQYPTPAQRPLNSRLNCTKLQHAFELTLPDWRKGVDRMLTEIIRRPS